MTAKCTFDSALFQIAALTHSLNTCMYIPFNTAAKELKHSPVTISLILKVKFYLGRYYDEKCLLNNYVGKYLTAFMKTGFLCIKMSQHHSRQWKKRENRVQKGRWESWEKRLTFLSVFILSTFIGTKNKMFKQREISINSFHKCTFNHML